MPVYSFGEDSPLKFNIPDKLALRYNEAVDEFLKAQQRFNQKYGRPWDPAKEPIKIKWSNAQRKAWGDFSKVFNQVNKCDGPFHVNDIMDDFLVRNVASAASTSSWNFSRALTLAVAGGALYGYLKRAR